MAKSLSTAVKIAAAVLVLAAALLGARHVARSPWPVDLAGEVAAFERRDWIRPPPKGAILFVGASNVRRWASLERDFPDRLVLNRGFGGSTIADLTRFADRLIFPYQPRAIFLRSGGNELAAGRTPEQVFGDFKELVAAVHARLPQIEITYISQNPSVARWDQHDRERALNAMIAEHARRPSEKVAYIEAHDFVLGPDGRPRPELFTSDGLHFAPEAYKLLAELLRPHLPPGPGDPTGWR